MAEARDTSTNRMLTDDDYRAQADFRHELRRFVHQAENHAATVGVTPQQHLLLLMIRGHPCYPHVTVSDIAERLQRRHHSASLLVDRAVQRGLLERHGDPADRRRVLVTLSKKGEHLLATITAANRSELPPLEAAIDHLRGLMER